MRFFEGLFLLVVALAILKLVCGPVRRRLGNVSLSALGFGTMAAVTIFEGWRWQMAPACLAFVLLMLAFLRKSDVKLPWRIAGALPTALMVAVSAILAIQFPILSLPEPAGPYPVGTFDYSITDESRKERYFPERSRELYVEVWYPAADSAGDFPVRTLFHELYDGSFTEQSLLFGYLRYVPTHSHIEAPVAPMHDEPFPLILFNHALDFGFTSQNQSLMEHLASHGYVVLSIAHPYQSAKVNLDYAGTVTRTSEDPPDLRFDREELYMGLVSIIMEASASMEDFSSMQAVLASLGDEYLALDDDDRNRFLAEAIARDEFHAYRDLVSEELLEDHFLYEHLRRNSLVEYWVEDNKFVLDSLGELSAPVTGITESVDTGRVGAIGMSFGGAAVGEFCKVDSRCAAGVNLDGTQYGYHWDQPVAAPFLMLYHDGYQGGNDYAYLPAAYDFWDYGVRGTMHTDFTDFVYVWPAMKKIGFSGSVDGSRMIEIMNTVQLNFFDHYLKGRPIPGELYSDIPEIAVRRHRAVTKSPMVKDEED